MLLEINQAAVPEIGAAEIQFVHSQLFPLLNGSPKQKRHAAQFVVPGIGAPVLVDQPVFMMERQNTGERPTVLADNTNLQPARETIAQVPKPLQRLGRQSMPLSRQNQKRIKCTQN